MKNIYFDMCAIPFYLMVLWTCHVRNMTRGAANRTFIAMTYMSLVSTISDLWMEYVVTPVPLSQSAVVLGLVLSYTYKIVRNASLVVYFIYIFRVTRTEYKLHSLKSRLLLWTPYTVLLVVLMQNLFTHNVFTVTAEGGYARGPLLNVLYVIAFLYAVAGSAYCIHCRRYLVISKWTALISIYTLTFTGVIIQMIWPHYAVEMFSTTIGTMLILLLIMRPEETLDGTGMMREFKAYQAELKRILRANHRFQVVVVQIMNATEIRSYIGDIEFQSYIFSIADEINRLYYDLRVHIDLFFEVPGSFYLILDSVKTDVPSLVPGFCAAVEKRIQHYADQGVRFEAKFCVIKCPEDLKDDQEILNLGRTFTQIDREDRRVYRARELIRSRDYGVLNHIKDVLNRVITQDTLQMHYQPVYDVRAQRFRSGEALARVSDTEYGMISPALFIPAAEKSGMIVPVGERILESVYRFISENDLAALGIDYIEINLSVAQCMQRDLPENVRQLQERYGVAPRQVNFEVTETVFDNLSSIMDSNLRELADMGYTFSLDDYGTGYSNIQRLRKLPLSLIKIDKSLVDDMFTDDGEVIFENTVRMMKGIHKGLVVEGVENRETAEVCARLSCDYIQGYYYSRPLSEQDFLAFLKEHNGP